MLQFSFSLKNKNFPLRNDLLWSLNFIRFAHAFLFYERELILIFKKSLEKDANLLSVTRVSVIFVIMLEPCDLTKLPPGDYM